jgi:hypothetical protein
LIIRPSGAQGPSLPRVGVSYIIPALFLLLEFLVEFGVVGEGTGDVQLRIISIVGVTVWLFLIARLHVFLRHHTDGSFPTTPVRSAVYHVIPLFGVIWPFIWTNRIARLVGFPRGWAGLAVLLGLILLRFDGALGLTVLLTVLLLITRAVGRSKEFKAIDRPAAPELPQTREQLAQAQP